MKPETNYSMATKNMQLILCNDIFKVDPELDLFVLCVDHWGTSWEYVPCVDNFKEEE